jgi:dimethylargininase
LSLVGLVRAPGSDLAACELTFREREPIDLDRARRQHADYVAALRALGVEVRVLPPLRGHPDGCFVEDPAVVLDGLAVLTRPGAASRRGEVAALGDALAEHRPVVRMESGTLEGGDVLRIGDTLHVGLSTRTDRAGIEELARLVAPHGVGVEAVRVRGALHLKTAVTWLGGDVLLANPAWVDLVPFGRRRVISVAAEEPFGANALRVGEALLVSASAPRTAERVAGLDREVHAVDIAEFHRAEAGLTCLSLIFRAPGPAERRGPLS